MLILIMLVFPNLHLDAFNQNLNHNLDMAFVQPVNVNERELQARERTRRSQRGALKRKDRDALDRCIDTLIAGDKKVSVKIKGHDFWCKAPPINESHAQRGFYVFIKRFTGELSHKKRFRLDDQVRFSFNIDEKGNIANIEFYVGSNGDFNQKTTSFDISAPQRNLPVRNWHADISTPQGSLFLDGSWRGIARLIAASTAVRMSQSFKRMRQPPGRSSLMLWNVDRNGKDYRTITLGKKNNSPLYCQNQCLAERQCRAWSYRPVTITRQKGRKYPARCWLKNNVPQGKMSNRVVSGVKPVGR